MKNIYEEKSLSQLTMWCNESYLPPHNPASNRQYISWLYDLIDIGEVQFDFSDMEDKQDENDDCRRPGRWRAALPTLHVTVIRSHLKITF